MFNIQRFIQLGEKLARESGDHSSIEKFIAYNNEHGEDFLVACREVSNNLPDIGFFSRAKRLAAFYVACEILDNLVARGGLDLDGAVWVLTLLKTQNMKFMKCILMFEMMLDQGKISQGATPRAGWQTTRAYTKVHRSKTR